VCVSRICCNKLVFVCIHVRMCMRVHNNAHAYTYVCVRVCACVYVCVCVCVRVCVLFQFCLCPHISHISYSLPMSAASLSSLTDASPRSYCLVLSLCIYIYIYKHTHTHMSTCIHTHTHACYQPSHFLSLSSNSFSAASIAACAISHVRVAANVSISFIPPFN